MYTNNIYSQAMRGYGNPQATLAIESSMDRLAEEAGMDRVEFRLLNANEPGEGDTPRVQDHDLRNEGMYRRGSQEAQLGSFKRGSGRLRACLPHPCWWGDRVYKSDGCRTLMKVDDYGKVDVFTGATDMGQGANTVIAQIVAEELGIGVKDVRVINTDTDLCSWDVGAHPSRTTFVAGNSALGAARKIKERILEIASRQMGELPERLDIKKSEVFCLDDPEKRLELGKLLRKAHFSPSGQMLMAKYFFDPSNENLDKTFRGNLSMITPLGSMGFG